MAAADYNSLVQNLYIAYFGRPADPLGLANFSASLNTAGAPTTVAGLLDAYSTNASVKSLVDSFGTSTESATLYSGADNLSFVNQIFNNVLNRDGKVAGLTFWANALSAGQITRGNAALAIMAGALGNTTAQGLIDAQVVAKKVAVAANFTAGIDTANELLGYTGATAAATARSMLSNVTDTTDATAFQATVDSTLTNLVNTYLNVSGTGVNITLTTGIDTPTNFTAKNDTFIATDTTLTALDTLDGGNGTDTLTIQAVGNLTVPVSASVKNIETVVITGAGTVNAATAGWTGETSLKSTSTGGATLTAASTADVTALDSTGAVTLTGGKSQTVTAVTNATLSGATGAVTATVSGQTGNIAVDGGTDVSVTSGSQAAAATITIGGTTAATGAVTVNATVKGANATSQGAITVTGGTTVDITTATANAVNTTNTQAAVTVNGNASTTSVSVKQAAAATAAATVVGVANGTVTIADANAGSATKAATISSVTLANYGNSTISSNALSKLSLSGASGTLGITSGLTTETVTTLDLTVNGLSGTNTITDSSNHFKTVNITATGADSTIANFADSAATALTVGGTKAVTFTSTAGLSALATVTVSGSAGVSGDFTAATVTDVNASATSGNNVVSIDVTKATYEGGSGNDTVTVTAAPTKTVTGGTGSDTLVINVAAATFSNPSASKISGFETLSLGANATGSYDATGFTALTQGAVTGAITYTNVENNATLTLTADPGAATTYTLKNATGTSDVLNLTLTKAGLLTGNTVTAAGIETVNITTADTQATPTNPLDTLTLVATSAATVKVSGNAGLNLTDTGTALTTVDASGITAGSFTFTAGALAASSVIKGSATGTNTIGLNAATTASTFVTYTGGSGNDVIASTNDNNNVFTLGDGANSINTGGAAGNGNNTVTAGAGADVVKFGNGNNTVSLGNGANTFTAGTGNNTYTGGTGVDTVTVGGGLNVLTLGTGADVVTISAVGANVNTYTSITDPHSGVQITLINAGTETVNATKVSLAGTAVFQDYANAVIAQANGGVATANNTNAALGWFQFNGDTYIVESLHDRTATAPTSFVNGTDLVIKLTGLVDLSTVLTAGTNVVTLA